jgi:urease accessory protein
VTTEIADPAPQLDLRFVRRGDRSVIDRRLFSWPFTLTRSFHLDRAPAHMLTLITQTTSGALQADDHLVQRLHIGDGAAAHVTTQGATAVHRAKDGTAARERVILTVDRGGYLEFLPEPKILFPDSALHQSIEINCDPEGAVAFSDAFLMHDPDRSGRSFRHFTSATTAHGTAGETLLLDRLELDEWPVRHGRRGEFQAFGTFYALLPKSLKFLESLCMAATAALADVAGLYAAASVLPGGIGISLRLAARDGAVLRRGLELGWIESRKAMTGEAPPSRRK